MPTVEELVKAIENLLKYAVYDGERNDECIMAVRQARFLIHCHNQHKVVKNG